MLNLNVTSPSLNELIARFDALPGEVNAALQSTVRLAQLHLRDQLAEEAPTGATGVLSTHFEADRPYISRDIVRGIVGTAPPAYYGIYVEGGTQAHRKGPPPIEPLRMWVSRVLMIGDPEEQESVAHAIQWSIKQRGVPAQHFASKTIEREQSVIDSFFTTALQRL